MPMSSLFNLTKQIDHRREDALSLSTVSGETHLLLLNTTVLAIH